DPLGNADAARGAVVLAEMPRGGVPGRLDPPRGLATHPLAQRPAQPDFSRHNADVRPAPPRPTGGLAFRGAEGRLDAARRLAAQLLSRCHAAGTGQVPGDPLAL